MGRYLEIQRLAWQRKNEQIGDSPATQHRQEDGAEVPLRGRQDTAGSEVSCTRELSRVI